MLAQEIETFYLIPAIRKALVKLMVKDGLQKKDICEKLKITKSAVSQYLSDKRGKNFILKEELLVETCKNIINGENQIIEIQKLIHNLKKSKQMCLIYEQNNMRPDDCDVCNQIDNSNDLCIQNQME